MCWSATDWYRKSGVGDSENPTHNLILAAASSLHNCQQQHLIFSQISIEVSKTYLDIFVRGDGRRDGCSRANLSDEMAPLGLRSHEANFPDRLCPSRYLRLLLACIVDD